MDAVGFGAGAAGPLPVLVVVETLVPLPPVVSDSFLRYWRVLEAIIPIKVDLVEAGLASGLPRAADRHGLLFGSP